MASALRLELWPRLMPEARTLMIVKNYTGDKLNFGLAAEKAKANGQRVNVVFVCDDVSVEGNSLVGQRGLAGVVFVHKIAGALASRG
jgi:triose/dihydroxyacetone kinase / FAD-AMP lyase (cyclizing)